MTTPQAIQTNYAGCRFRSRLEARWAVFFDTLGIPWEYESQGYECGDVRYLPDFWLPEWGCLVEVKGSVDGLDADRRRMGYMMDFGRLGLSDTLGSERGLLLLGPLPRVDLHNLAPAHWLIQHHKGVGRSLVTLRSSGPAVVAVEDWTVEQDLPLDDPVVSSDLYPYVRNIAPPDRVISAYTAARSARFEHGERGVSPAPAQSPRWPRPSDVARAELAAARARKAAQKAEA